MGILTLALPVFKVTGDSTLDLSVDELGLSTEKKSLGAWANPLHVIKIIY